VVGQPTFVAESSAWADGSRPEAGEASERLGSGAFSVPKQEEIRLLGK
jgi:hypothetical protein